MSKLILKNLIKNIVLKSPLKLQKNNIKDLFWKKNNYLSFLLFFNTSLIIDFFLVLKLNSLQKSTKSFVSFYDILDKKSFIWNDENRKKSQLSIKIGPFINKSTLSIAQNLRHLLLTNIGSYKISKLKIYKKDLKVLNSFEFDFNDFLENLKNIIFIEKRNSLFFNFIPKNELKEKEQIKTPVFIKFIGPGIITASNLKDLPSQLEILNKNQFLSMNLNSTNINFESYLNYSIDSFDSQNQKKILNFDNYYIINLFPIYNPILSTSFEIEQQLFKTNDKKYKKADFINLKIKTNGSVSALESLFYTCQLYLNSLKN